MQQRVQYDAPRPQDWCPNAGPQTAFLRSSAFEVLYGGAAGGGKSEGVLALALRRIHEPSYRALILRRTYPELEQSIIDRSMSLYGQIDGTSYNATEKVWTFPSGALIRFGHAQNEKDVHRYQGAEFQFVAPDELTHFTLKQYTYLLSRARSSRGVPIRIRATTNPGGEGHEWVFHRWGPWLSPEFVDVTGTRVSALPGETLWYIARDKGDEYVPKGTPGSLSRTFIPAKLSDTPQLAGTGYEQQLNGLDPVTREQLKNGNWLIKPAAGLFFKRIWIKHYFDVAPVDVTGVVRYWDLAAGGDYAVGLRMSRLSTGLFIVEHVERLRGTPYEVRAAVLAIAEQDGIDVPIVIEQDPGQAGKDQIFTYAQDLAGWNFRGRVKRIDKPTAFAPVSAQAEAGNIAIVRGRWNVPWFDELEAFPEKGVNDDQVDATSGAFQSLINAPLPASAGHGSPMDR